MIRTETRRAFLALVRSVLADKLGCGAPLDEASRRVLETDPLFQEARGVFVTLHKNGALRGCIGYIETVAPLVRALPEMALAAAFQDPRFPALTAGELSGIDIEISILSPLFPLDPADVEVGKHGLVVTRGGRRGLLLPQVPVEQGWDRETYLAHTCLKAGLPVNALDSGATLEGFTATVFGEHDDLHSNA